MRWETGNQTVKSDLVGDSKSFVSIQFPSFPLVRNSIRETGYFVSFPVSHTWKVGNGNEAQKASWEFNQNAGSDLDPKTEPKRVNVLEMPGEFQTPPRAISQAKHKSAAIGVAIRAKEMAKILAYCFVSQAQHR